MEKQPKARMVAMTKAVAITEQIRREQQELEKMASQCSPGLADEIKALAEKRRALALQLDTELNREVVPLPGEVEKYCTPQVLEESR